MPASLTSGVDGNEKLIENFIIEILENRHFHPTIQSISLGILRFVFRGCDFAFACPIIKLKNLGWQNLDAFRRVFPSFTSLLGFLLEGQLPFLLHDETLSIAAFGENCGVPRHIFSMPIEENPQSIEASRKQVLSLINLEKYK